MTKLSTAAAAAWLLAPALFAQSAASESAAIARIEQQSKLRENMAELKVPGVSIAVVRDSKIVWAKGYGVRVAGGKDPVEANTMFQAASISKPITAMAAMHLSQFGAFTLDEDVNGKLKSWRVPENAFTADAKVTARSILSHSAGLTVHGFRGYAKGEAVPTVIQVLNGEKPANSSPVVVDAKPGTLWRYSGGGFTILQLLVTERMAGKTFPEIMSMIVLGKLGMRNSTYEQPLPAPLHKQAAHGHRRDGTEVPGAWHTYPEMAAAGLWTTPSDLALAAIEMQKAQRGESNKVIEQKTAQEMLKTQKGKYGLGWGLEPSDWFTHGGSNEGFKCMLLANDRNAIVIMTNGDEGAKLFRGIVEAAAVEYGWTVPKP